MPKQKSVQGPGKALTLGSPRDLSGGSDIQVDSGRMSGNFLGREWGRGWGGGACRRDRTACAIAWRLGKEWLEAQQSRCGRGITEGDWGQKGKRVSRVPCWGVSCNWSLGPFHMQLLMHGLIEASVKYELSVSILLMGIFSSSQKVIDGKVRAKVGICGLAWDAFSFEVLSLESYMRKMLLLSNLVFSIDYPEEKYSLGFMLTT